MRAFLEIISAERLKNVLSRHRDVVLSFYRGRIYSTEVVRLSEILSLGSWIFSSNAYVKRRPSITGAVIPSNPYCLSFQDKIRLLQDDLESERELRQRVSSMNVFIPLLYLKLLNCNGGHRWRLLWFFISKIFRNVRITFDEILLYIAENKWLTWY